MNLLERKKGSLCIWIGLCIVSLCVIFMSSGSRGVGSLESYSVSIRHYGVDTKEMERSVAIPLEDALFAIPGVLSVQSSSENSMARVFVRFKSRKRGQYEAVREAVQRVYEGLPSSVQRPEIVSSNNSRIPVWSAAVYSVSLSSADTAQLLERTLKPRLEGLDGAGEVIVSGVGMNEIIVAVDQEKAAALGLTSAVVAWSLGMNDALFPGGSLVHEGREIIVSVDGRYPLTSSFPTHSLQDALISLGNGKAVTLSDIACVYVQERSPDTLSRLNGKKAATISVMGNSDADLRRLSRDIKNELEKQPLLLEFTVLSDRGAEEAAAFRSVFWAALQGACMVALISFLLSRGKPGRLHSDCLYSDRLYSGRLYFDRSSFFCAMSVPAVCLTATALLALCGFPPDRFTLAGIAAGAGAAVDPAILLTERLRRCREYHEASAALKNIRGPLIAGSATTVAALLQLASMEGASGPVVWAIGAVTITALFLSLSLLPPLLLWDMERMKKFNHEPHEPTRIYEQRVRVVSGKIFLIFYFSGRRISRNLFRKMSRFLAVNVRLCTRRPAYVCLVALALSAVGIAAIVHKGTDPGTYGSEDSVYGHFEFEGGLLSEETDRLLAAYSEELAGKKGITNVQTGAKTGSGLALISFDPKQIDADKAKNLARSIPVSGGFLFFPETSSKERHWEIKISGDDDERLRELAEELAQSCASLPLIKERVLNFKAGSGKLILKPIRENFAEAAIPFATAAELSRRGIHGPVAYKRTDANGETDLRVRSGLGTGREPHKADVFGLLLPPENEGTAIRLDSLMQFKEGREPASLRREDRRRTASITVSTPPMDPRRVKAHLEKTMNALALPAGYSISFDPDAIKKARSLSGAYFSFLLALAFCYIVIASVNESFTVPLAILAAVPPSLAVPAIVVSVAGNAFNAQAACAFVAVSGMAVNAAVLCASAFGFMQNAVSEKSLRIDLCLYRALRRQAPALFATTATTVAGALPFLFLHEGANSLARTLSLVAALGVGSSFFCAISVVPALLLILTRYAWKGIPPARKGMSDLGYYYEKDDRCHIGADPGIIPHSGIFSKQAGCQRV